LSKLTIVKTWPTLRISANCASYKGYRKASYFEGGNGEAICLLTINLYINIYQTKSYVFTSGDERLFNVIPGSFGFPVDYNYTSGFHHRNIKEKKEILMSFVTMENKSTLHIKYKLRNLPQ